MRQLVEKLLALQKLYFGPDAASAPVKAQVAALREQVPASVLGHFDRFIARGKNGVAIARRGVCSECHLRISSGTLASLAYTSDIHRCGHCDRYLYLPEDEPLGLMDADSGRAASPPVRRKRKAAQRVR